MHLSVIIPCYNEERRIISTLQSICAYLNKDYEIIVVDDHSEDRTAECVYEFIKLNPKANIRLLKNKGKQGKGCAVKEGMLRGKGEYLLFCDADLSTPIQEIDKLFYWLDKGYDIAIGSRALKESQVIVHQLVIREFMGKIFNKLARFLLLTDLSDTQCGFKLFKKHIAQKLFSLSRINGFSFDIEILYLARKLGFKVKEVPIKWTNSPASRVHIAFDSIRMLIDLFKIKHNA